MAERSFAREVQDLRLGDGEIFRGEGILALTKALLQSGVAYVAGYQGSPISHLMDVLADAKDVLDELGVHFESSASEAAAAATLSASVMYPLRGAVTWKSTAGTNVASDALTNLASSGVNGGALIILGEDYGEGSSIPQERSHAFAMKSQIWLLDPRPNLESIVKSVEDGFALSEASHTPVMLQVRIRACHVHGQFIAKTNKPPSFTLREALERPQRDVNRVVLPLASMLQDRQKLQERWPATVEHIRKQGLNEFFGPAEGDIGIILQGGMYNSVIRALQYLGLADAYGETTVPLYVLNVTYPLVDDEVAAFCADKRAVLMVEEGHPAYLEQAVGMVLRRHKLSATLAGKDVLPLGGDYTAAVLTKGIDTFLAAHAPPLLGNRAPPPNADAVLATPKVKGLATVVPPHPAGFCTGCPERPIFAAMKLVEKELGPHHISSDIGCHLFSILPPFNLGGTTMGQRLAEFAQVRSCDESPIGAGQNNSLHGWIRGCSGQTVDQSLPELARECVDRRVVHDEDGDRTDVLDMNGGHRSGYVGGICHRRVRGMSESGACRIGAVWKSRRRAMEIPRASPKVGVEWESSAPARSGRLPRARGIPDAADRAFLQRDRTGLRRRPCRSPTSHRGVDRASAGPILRPVP